MSISDIVTVNITKQTTGIDRIGFGTAMLMSAEASVDSKFAETAKIYTQISELGSTGDAYDVDGVIFAKVQSLFSQNPKPAQVVIGKRSLPPLMTITMTPIAANSQLYRVTISGAHTAAVFTGSTDFDYTSDASATVAEITAGLVAALDQTLWVTLTPYVVGDYVRLGDRVYICTVAGTSGATGPTGTGSAIVDGTVTWAHKGPSQDVAGTDNTTDLTIEKAASPGGAGTAGIPFIISVNDRELLEQQNVTADPGVVTDLGLIRGNVDGNDDWYLSLLDSSGQAEIEALAANIESTGTPGKAFFYATSDADVLTSATDDVMSNLQATAVVRTMGFWHEDPMNGPEAGWAGVGLPKDPGSITWNAKTIAGTAVSVLTSSEKTNIQGKDGNYYITIAGRNLTQIGITPGNEFFDVTRGIDFIAARMAENIFFVIAQADKIRFTDAGIAIIETEIRGVLSLGVTNNIFTDNPAPSVTVPLANSVNTVDRANRLLPDMDWQAQLAGAIHEVIVNGIVTV